MTSASTEPRRFRDLARRTGRDRDRSRVAVAVLKADSRVSQVLERALAQAGLTLPQFNILTELASTPDAALPLHELNRRLVSTPPSTSWLSNEMEQAGLVIKSKDPRDSRVVVLAMTEHAWTLLEAGLTVVSAAEKKLLSAYTRDEQSVLVRLLGRLIEPADQASRQA